jgi:hypothetical protein
MCSPGFKVCFLNSSCKRYTEGPEVRTAMLKDHEPIMLEAGQDIIVYAAGPDEYTTFEGYKTPEVRGLYKSNAVERCVVSTREPEI